MSANLDLDIAPDDPLLAWFVESPGAVELSRIHIDSPAVRALRAAGVELVIPLVSQGELIGLINLGPRRSDQAYSPDDRRMLTNLAGQAAPAVRVAQLVRQQQAEAAARERVEQELHVARIIQETLLPKELPQLSNFRIAAFWQPAREVGGDFYDFLWYPDGRLALIIGDVTDKGVPAALVMATTRSVLRAAVEQLPAPGDVLQRANELLCPDIPPKMFVTCLIAVLDPSTGRLRYANAGHDVPYKRGAHGVEELWATGMPLGLLPGMTYTEQETTLHPGEQLVLYSDGIVEAHNPGREMFGFKRLRRLIASHAGGEDLIPYLLDQLAAFTGDGWEQEDDVTIVTLEHAPTAGDATRVEGQGGDAMGEAWQTISEFSLASVRGNERQAMHKVAEVLAGAGLSETQTERLKTAVAEATMNAMEHGSHYDEALPVTIQVQSSPAAIRVRITDRGGERPIPEKTAPDLDAKLAGLQSPRGWGLFLIRSMVDEVNTTSDAVHHTIELVVSRGEAH